MERWGLRGQLLGQAILYLAMLARRAFVAGSSVGRACCSLAIAIAICIAPLFPAAAQKHGGTLNVYISASPSSLSILEEVSFTAVMAAGPVFSGLVVFDPLKPVGGIDTVIPELAESWAWDES